MTKMESVAELEAKILQGEAVTADQLASAKAREEAAERVAQLNQQREAALALEERRRKALDAFKSVAVDFHKFVADRSYQDTIDQIKELTIKAEVLAHEHNSALTDLRRRIDAARSIEPSAPLTGSANADGLTSCDGVNANPVSDWAMDCRRALDDAIVAGNNARAQRRNAEEGR